ncbi:hypothetical protein DNU06_06435 [Putridiphycobacter roseus]|uniref:PKD domain-containing protein n=2 Tax=Putridiphycobacter roseus TaxID=2219161 RepID=A0A2W1N368_9FLAO|nr:hypothetical protein DNU06_06435 [Putridiphycobacter roseus]
MQWSSFSQIVINANGCSPLELFDTSNPWIMGGSNSSWTWANPNKLQIMDDISIGGKAILLGGNTPTSTYNTNENSWAMSPEFDLSAVNNPFISFNFFWSNEGSDNNDEIWMEYSLNNGGTWAELDPSIGTGTCYDQNWYNYPDNWGGNNGGCSSGTGGPTDWVSVRKCINLLSNEPSVRFRFRLSANGSCENYGAAMDNFQVCDVTVTAAATYQCGPQPFEIEFTDASFICPTDWQWDFGDGFTSTVQNPIHTYAQAGTYQATLIVGTSTVLSSACGGPVHDTLHFNVDVFELIVDSLFNASCIGSDNGQAFIGSVGMSTALDYAWTPAPGTGQNTNIGGGLSPITYAVVGTSQLRPSCVSTISFSITEPTQISAVVTSVNSTCTGPCDGSLSAVVSGGTPPYNVVWQPLNLVGSTVQNVCPDTYDLTITDSNGCVETMVNAATITFITSAMIIPIADEDVCQLEQLAIPPFAYSTTNTNATWEVLEGIDVGFGITGSGNIPSFNAIGTNSLLTVNIKVTPVANGSCIGITDTFKINIHPAPIVDFSSADTAGCVSKEVNFNLLNYNPNYTYFWDFGNGQSDFNANTGTQSYNSGSYDVSLSVVTNYCATTLVKSNYINVYPAPKVDFSFSPGKIDPTNPQIYFNNLSENANTYAWDFGDGIGASTTESPTYIYENKSADSYIINLVASNASCSAEISKSIFYEESVLIYVPNAFTPDNNGNNDSFKPIVESGIDIYDYELNVFNRWGELVFQSFDPVYGWDGCYGNDCDQPLGVYTWKIYYHLENNATRKERYGTVLLLK